VLHDIALFVLDNNWEFGPSEKPFLQQYLQTCHPSLVDAPHTIASISQFFSGFGK